MSHQEQSVPGDDSDDSDFKVNDLKDYLCLMVDNMRINEHSQIYSSSESSTLCASTIFNEVELQETNVLDQTESVKQTKKKKHLIKNKPLAVHSDDEKYLSTKVKTKSKRKTKNKNRFHSVNCDDIEQALRQIKLTEEKTGEIVTLRRNYYSVDKNTEFLNKEYVKRNNKRINKLKATSPTVNFMYWTQMDVKSKMEWLLVNPQIHTMFASLGSFVQDTYVINPDCLMTLDEIWKRLSVEDGTLRTFRRAIGLSQIVKKDFLPLLINCKEDERITDLTIKILAYLTMPVECLLPMEVMLKTEAGRNTIYELNMFLSSCKEAFLDPRATKRIVEHIKSILDKINDAQEKSEHFYVLNDSVILLRNILHIPEFKHGTPVTTTQNQILWNMFAHNMDKVVIELMVNKSKSCLGLALVQLIALMYKDQHAPTLQKLLNIWFETSLSESSEDNESNTSPPERDFGDSSSFMTTPDPTSDSSDNSMGETGTNKNDFNGQPEQNNHLRHLQMLHMMQQDNNQQLKSLANQHGSNHYNQHSHHSQQNYLNQQERSHLMQSQSLKHHTHHMQQQNHGHNLQQSNGHRNQSQSQVHHNQQKNHFNQKGSSNQNSKKNNSSSRNKNSKQNNKKQMDLSSRGGCSDKQVINQPGTSQHAQMSNPFSQTHYQQAIGDKSQHPSTQLSQAQKKVECMSEHSDCGYGTQLDTQESISTSSNDDDSPDRNMKPVHQKPSNMMQKARQPNNKTLTSQEKDALRRQKLNRRRRLSSVKALLHHSPSDEDINHLLKEFTVDFLLKGYSSLVTELHNQLLFNSQAKTHMDSSHFFWLITYFLKFATQLEVDLEHISPVLSEDILFYLTYEGVMLCEEFELAKTKQSDYDLAPCIRRMHLVVTAIRELLQAIETYMKMPHQNEKDLQHLNRLQKQISGTEDIRCLFVLMLRQFNPSLQCEQFLKDLVVTNHNLLAFIEKMNPHPSLLPLFQSHIKQFAHADVMKQYGLLLEKFQENGKHVNDCIFTMMHHVAADAEGVSALFQPPILKTFSLIFEFDFQLCDDWSDLIEFVITKFIKTPKSVNLFDEEKNVCSETIHKSALQAHQGWTEEDYHNLYWYYVQSACLSDPVGSVIQLYTENGVLYKTRIEVIEKLLQQDIITRFQYQELLEKEPIATIKESGWDDEDDDTTTVKPPDEIETLRNHLIKNNKSEQVYWVQKVLMEACNAKISLMKKSNTPGEPVPFYSIYGQCVSVIEKGIPLVAWNCDQAAIMHYQPFILLLHKLGLQLPADVGKAFARIPYTWSPEQLISAAKKLGPLNPKWLKYDWETVEGIGMEEGSNHEDDGQLTFQHNTANYITYTPKPNIGGNSGLILT